jgi:hypothetical protein
MVRPDGSIDVAALTLVTALLSAGAFVAFRWWSARGPSGNGTSPASPRFFRRYRLDAEDDASRGSAPDA